MYAAANLHPFWSLCTTMNSMPGLSAVPPDLVRDHTVHFYEADDHLLDSLTEIIGTALISGHAAIVIATAPHRDGLAERLNERGLNLEIAARQGRYYVMDAAETLSTIMVGGRPQAALILPLFTSVLSSIRVALKTYSPSITFFGEMVSLLCSDGHFDAAIELERIWNDLVAAYSIHLHCGYPIHNFDREDRSQAFRSICSEHSHVIPTESYTNLISDDARLRQVSRLQQLAGSAEAETAERKEAQQSLQAFFHHGYNLAFIMKPDGNLVDVNNSAVQQSGLSREQLIGRPIWDSPWWSTLPEEQALLRSAIAAASAGEDICGDCAYNDAEDATRFASRSITPVRNEAGKVTLLVGTVTISPTAFAPKRPSRRAEKLATVGRLAASIAHEINNPLEAISNAIYLARSSPGEMHGYLSMADQELARVAQITKQTLGFYRETAAPTIVRVSNILDELLNIYGRKLQLKNLIVHKQYRDEIEIWGLEGELRQVFANQISNAIYALPAGGSLTLRIKSRSPSNGHGPGITVSLADSGSGIPPESLRRIFEPFYTTKQDVGTGLGLWITQGIVRKHGGHIRVRSSVQPGRSGTIFTTFLPQHGGETQPPQSQS